MSSLFCLIMLFVILFSFVSSVIALTSFVSVLSMFLRPVSLSVELGPGLISILPIINNMAITVALAMIFINEFDVFFSH